MALERAAIQHAIDTTRTFDHAADKLGASRRTLQNHMRVLGMPRGQAGRPRHELPFRGSSAGESVLVLGGIGVLGYFAYRWFTSRPAVVGAHADSYLRGVAAIL